MGKAGRVACIFTPYAMTIVSLALLIIVELGGKNASSGLLNSVYTWQADFSNLTIPANPNLIGQRLQAAKNTGKLENLYQIHVYNYCSSTGSAKSIANCSAQNTGFVFDFINTWHLNDTTTTTKRDETSLLLRDVSSTVTGAETQIKNLFGQGVLDSLQAYQKASQWMGIAFQVALWSSLATAVAGILAIFSRWGSLITWLLSFVSALFGFGAALTATIIFGALVGTLKAVLDPYKVELDLGGTFLGYVWVSVALSIGATSFWLFSVCCCSGKSNPHHRSNKGGLWQAEPEEGAYGPVRGMRVEQTGYQRMSSPYIGAGDRVPLQEYPSSYPPSMPTQHMPMHHKTDSYEPYRYQR